MLKKLASMCRKNPGIWQFGQKKNLSLAYLKKKWNLYKNSEKHGLFLILVFEFNICYKSN